MTGQMKRRIRERWQELRPYLTIIARATTPNPAIQLEVWELVHSERVLSLLQRGIRLRTIRRYDLDEPQDGPEKFAVVMAHAVRNLRKSPPRPRQGLAKFTSKRLVSSSSESKGTTQGDNE